MARWSGRRRDTAMLEARRREAIELLALGLTQADVARRLAVTPAAVCRWKKGVERGGLSTLGSIARSGRPPFIHRNAQSRLPILLSPGPRSFGFPTDDWSLALIVEAAAIVWGVRYSRSSMWRILNRQGFRWHRLGDNLRPPAGVGARDPAGPRRGWGLVAPVRSFRAAETSGVPFPSTPKAGAPKPTRGRDSV